MAAEGGNEGDEVGANGELATAIEEGLRAGAEAAPALEDVAYGFVPQRVENPQVDGHL